MKNNRYFDISDWNRDQAEPKASRVYNFYASMKENSYVKWPVLRVFCVTGTMFTMLLVGVFYAWWCKDRPAGISLFLILLVVGTCMCGPVSDIRYYLILFEAFPILLGYLYGRRRAAGIAVEMTDENDTKQEIA